METFIQIHINYRFLRGSSSSCHRPVELRNTINPIITTYVEICGSMDELCAICCRVDTLWALCYTVVGQLYAPISYTSPLSSGEL